MEVHFTNLDKFKRFIEKHVKPSKLDMQYFINDLILRAYGGKESIYMLHKCHTIGENEQSIRYEVNYQQNEEEDAECIQIRF